MNTHPMNANIEPVTAHLGIRRAGRLWYIVELGMGCEIGLPHRTRPAARYAAKLREDKYRNIGPEALAKLGVR